MTTTTHFDQLQLAERWGLSPKTLERWRHWHRTKVHSAAWQGHLPLVRH